MDLESKLKKEEIKIQYEEEEEDDDEDGGDQPNRVEENKRGVAFKILKNKGLTPKRKKENRNPRVKNRNKFKKALRRRKGQIQGRNYIDTMEKLQESKKIFQRVLKLNN